MRLLLTGFRPFLHHSENSSEQVLSALAKVRSDIETLVLSVSFENSFLELQRHLDSNPPYDFVVMMGQARGRALVSLERVALNWMESRNPDNDGACATGNRILTAAPDSYIIDFFPSAWTEKISQNLGAPQGTKLAAVSLTAGSYVCNNLYFKTAHHFLGTTTKPLFVHLPLLPEQISKDEESPSMNLQTQINVVNELLHLLKNV